MEEAVSLSYGIGIPSWTARSASAIQAPPGWRAISFDDPTGDPG